MSGSGPAAKAPTARPFRLTSALLPPPASRRFPHSAAQLRRPAPGRAGAIGHPPPTLRGPLVQPSVRHGSPAPTLPTQSRGASGRPPPRRPSLTPRRSHWPPAAPFPEAVGGAASPSRPTAPAVSHTPLRGQRTPHLATVAIGYSPPAFPELLVPLHVHQHHSPLRLPAESQATPAAPPTSRQHLSHSPVPLDHP